MEAIAVIGFSGSFPQSSSVKEFWQHLCDGKELISFIDTQTLLEEGLDPQIVKHPQYVKAKALLPDADCFDASFFGYSAREAAYIDPQQRVLLQDAWSALEHAGYDAEQYKGSIGVFAGCSFSSYFCFNLFPQLNDPTNLMQDEMLMVLGTEKDFLSTRISYKLNLRGPSKCIQTACSTSLVAVHDACQSLLNYECDIALTGGVSITSPLQHGYMYSKEGINSPDGHCRAFDHRAEGTVMGNGAGIVVLKRLTEAIADRDTIFAVIKGSAINNDGARKIGYTAPSVEGQAEVIIAAQLSAGVDADNISYIEAHGTGTVLGDPIEIKALSRAFCRQTNAKQFCKIASLKTNIGHLDAAAGIAGLIKTILVLQHRLIPPSLHFEKPNEAIAFSETPFIVNDSLTEFSGNSPFIAGVSSFGIGGSNAHLILEEAPKRVLHQSDNSCYLFLFSGKNNEALKRVLMQFLANIVSMNYPLADISYTLQVGRKRLEYRACFISESKENLIQLIRTYIDNGLPQSPPRSSVTSNELSNKLKKKAEDWLQGTDCDWENYYRNEKRSRVPLPTYPFLKERHWIYPKHKHALSIAKPEYSSSHLSAETPDVSNVIELGIIEIWKKSLKLVHLSSRDDFFALGGDSLLALEILEELRKRFSVELNLRQVIENRTVEELAKTVEESLISKISTLSEKQVEELLK